MVAGGLKEPGGGVLPYKMTEVIAVPSRGKICVLVPLRVLEFKKLPALDHNRLGL